MWYVDSFSGFRMYVLTVNVLDYLMHQMFFNRFGVIFDFNWKSALFLRAYLMYIIFRFFYQLFMNSHQLFVPISE